MDRKWIPESREEAIRWGYTSYFSGKPCFNGHIDKKYTCNNQCHECARQSAKRYYYSNREKRLEYGRKWRKENPEKQRELDKKWREKNQEYVKEYCREWREKNPNYEKEWRLNNPGKSSAKVARRRAQILKCTPKWSNQEEIEKIYNKAKEIQKETNIKMVVDHIIPLQGENVCGLHVENNLQILTTKQNGEKYNHFIDGSFIIKIKYPLPQYIHLLSHPPQATASA